MPIANILLDLDYLATKPLPGSPLSLGPVHEVRLNRLDVGVLPAEFLHRRRPRVLGETYQESVVSEVLKVQIQTQPLAALVPLFDKWAASHRPRLFPYFSPGIDVDQEMARSAALR